MNRQKKIGITIIVIAVILLISGILLLYNYQSKKLYLLGRQGMYEANREISYYEDETNMYIRMALYPSSSSCSVSQSYYYVLKKDGTLLCYYGTRSRYNINTNYFMKSFEEKKAIKIEDSDFRYIKELLENLKNDPPSDMKFALDSWEASLLYNGAMYEIDYFFYQSETLKKIVDKIVELSPIEVVMTW